MRWIVCGWLLIAVSLGGCRGTDPTADVVFEPKPRAGDDTVIAFISCIKEQQPAPIAEHLFAYAPDVVAMLGDNVYVSKARGEKTPEVYEEVYGRLDAWPYWQRIREDVPLLLATWDDHDYGKNDAGQEWPQKQVGKDAFLEFFPDSAAQIPDGREGVYHAKVLGESGRRVQLIFLDTRWFRGPVDRKPGPRGARGPYRPSDDTTRTLLGEAQWAWLGEQLREPAEVRVIVSSIQVVAREHGWECWGNFPHELDRLYRTIREAEANGVVFVSGDRHLAELSRDSDSATPYPMWDATSSGLNEGFREVDEPNRYRVGGVHRRSNFGLIRIDWSAEPTVGFELIGANGGPFESKTIPLSALRMD